MGFMAISGIFESAPHGFLFSAREIGWISVCGTPGSLTLLHSSSTRIRLQYYMSQKKLQKGPEENFLIRSQTRVRLESNFNKMHGRVRPNSRALNFFVGPNSVPITVPNSALKLCSLACVGEPGLRFVLFSPRHGSVMLLFEVFFFSVQFESGSNLNQDLKLILTLPELDPITKFFWRCQSRGSW